MQLTGSEIIIECLKEQGVDTVFGYPGGTILNVYDALYKHSNEITHILTSHEQGAAHAADGYARATGRVGVCMATSGPGATNLVTGIATAYMDSVPIVAITANVGVNLLGKDSFQEVDITGVTTPITKHNFMVKDVRDLANTLRRAFEIARSGRPGPVLVDVTKDVTANKCEYSPAKPATILPLVNSIEDSAIDEAVAAIADSQKPFVLIGGGAVMSGAAEQVREFVNLIDAPACDTLMGKGVMPGTDPHYTGMIGMHGTKTSNLGVSQCDLLIILGSRLSDRVLGNAKTFAADAKIIHIDIDPAEINKNKKADIQIIGDLAEVLTRLNAKVEKKENPDWMARIEEFKKKYPLSFDENVLSGPFIIRTINEITKGDAIIATEVGQHQMWAAQFYDYLEPRTLITSGGCGTMGYGLGASLGAKMARKDKLVFNIAGDGCFRMNMNEIATATRYNIPIIEVVINNHVLGMVRQWQTLFYGQRYSNTVLNDHVDFCGICDAMGAKTFKVTKKEELEPAIREAIRLNIPCVIECVIDPDDKVFPMVAPGKPIAECFDGDDLKKDFG